MLIDTSGWFCLFDELDRRNKTALSFYESYSLRVTHSYVIAELLGLVYGKKEESLESARFR